MGVAVAVLVVVGIVVVAVIMVVVVGVLVRSRVVMVDPGHVDVRVAVDERPVAVLVRMGLESGRHGVTVPGPSA
jgi:Na+-transporting NADH:ubiquinone oxidoreductase subunit NqrF